MEKTPKQKPVEPEELHAHGDAPAGAGGKNPPATPIRRRLRTYRPSHKATFIGIAVVIAILAVNVIVIFIVFKAQQPATSKTGSGSVAIDTSVLSKLGVNKGNISGSQTQLTVDPNAKFNGSVTVANDVNVAGQLKLNGPFSASMATLAKLQAGDTAVQSLNVNGDGTVSTLSLRKDLNVAGTTRLQGPVTISQLTTVNNSLNVSGNLAIGGSLSTRSFEALTITADNGLVVGGHVSTRGSAPNVGQGPAVGSNGTVSISGNDISGTIAVNAGNGAGGGLLAQVAFRSAYPSTPHVVVSPVGMPVSGLYISRSANGFNIYVMGGMPAGGYAFDYIVMQ